MNELSRRLGERAPKTAIILGSSLGAVVEAVDNPLVISYGDLPGFPQLKISGHAGNLVLGTIADCEVAILQGRAHPYESGNAAVMGPAIGMLKDSGIETLILTNAAGSLDVKMRPGSIMLIEDHINFSGMNPLIGVPGDRSFVPLTDAYDPDLRKGLRAAAKQAGVKLYRGTYVWFSGPSFETPAEIRMAAKWGGDAVGMSTVPETIIARYCGLRVAGLSVITNLGAGLEGAAPSHEETKREGAKAAADMIRLLAQFFAGR